MMSSLTKQDALLELEAIRKQLLERVNTSIDALISKLESGEAIDAEPVEMAYPLTIDPRFFKGTKPTSLYFGDEKVDVKKWRGVYTEILRRCAALPEKHATLMSLRGRIHGRTRTILSGKPDGMDAPIEVADGLYAEGFYDTEYLLRVLTTEILDAVRYDYSEISVAVVNGKGRR